MNRPLQLSITLLLVNAAVLSLGQLPGDFNEDGIYDCSDIDALNRDVATGGGDLIFDLDDDGQVVRSDIEAWLRIAGTANHGEPYKYGDANLDGQVDNSDLGGIWNGFKFTTSDQWCHSDHNSDGVVDLYDGLLVTTNLLNNDEDVGYDPEPVDSDIARFVYDPQTGYMFTSTTERIGGWIIRAWHRKKSHHSKTALIPQGTWFGSTVTSTAANKHGAFLRQVISEASWESTGS